jgi:ribosomal protein L14E/L6E/L27E
MCTKAETINTGSNIDTVKLSNKKDQDRSSNSESNQVARETVTEEPAKATSKNAMQLSKEARDIAEQAKI